MGFLWFVLVPVIAVSMSWKRAYVVSLWSVEDHEGAVGFTAGLRKGVPQERQCFFVDCAQGPALGIGLSGWVLWLHER